MSFAFTKVFVSFWLFGLLNNVLYVVILSAAVDLVGPSIPKSVVLVADVLPSLIVKLTSPFFIHKIHYDRRILILIGLSFFGMLSISFGGLGMKILGIALASASAGLGELTFLQLTHFYDVESLQGWSGGTGGAGLVGSAVYLLLTTVLRFNIKTSLLLFSILPFGFIHYFRLDKRDDSGFLSLDQEANRQLGTSDISHIRRTIHKIQPLLRPYMIPLTLVYFGEYLINQGISPTLLFPIDGSNSSTAIFTKYRDIYVVYGTVYQLGVFISRSSSSFVRIHNLYLPSLQQILNVALALIQSMYYIIPNFYVIIMLIFYEGLLGGVAYVNTFMKISEDLSSEEREFALGSVTIADSLGILTAAFLGLWLEPELCGYQVAHGRDWCTLE